MWPSLVCVIQVFAMAAPDSRQAITVNVMSFNLRHALAMDGENSWPYRRDVLIAAIKHCDPDVLGTQECLKVQAEYVAEKLPAYQWIGIGRDPGGAGEMAAVFYKKDKLSAVESGYFWLSETPDVPASKSWDASLTRMATWVRFKQVASQQQFHYLNTHFDHRGVTARANSAKLLVDRVGRWDAKYPVIITGDFNADAERSSPWQILTSNGFSDTWLAAEKREGPKTTFGGFKAPDPNADGRIDWILVRGSLHVPYCEIVTYNDHGRYPSDHYPVLAQVTLQEPPPDAKEK